MLLELVVVVALIVLNGLLAMSELAVVSSRPARLKARAERGDRPMISSAVYPFRAISTLLQPVD